jgi:competence protein ComFA
MLAPKYFIYQATGPGLKPRIEMSSNLRVDCAWLAAHDYLQLTFFQPAQTVWIAEMAVRQLRTVRQELAPRRFFKLVKRIIGPIGMIKYCNFQTLTLTATGSELETLGDLEQQFWGRAFLGSELPDLFRSAGYAVPWNPEDWTQQLVLEAKITRTAAVSYNNWGMPECRRCGATHGIYEADCLFCGARHCLTCSNCQTLGRATSCAPLYYQSYPEHSFVKQPVQPRLDLTLTPAQQRAMEALDAFCDSGRPAFLVWAVCGGGKTEVSFEIIARVLTEGGRVLFAIPRKEVVNDLVPRLQDAFPMVELAVLSGETHSYTARSRLVLATTHQSVRFYHSFDLVVLDEADAFPYQGSEMLHHAVRRALKSTGRLVVMTATPNRQMLDQIKGGQLPYVTIPARYHRQALVEPEIVLVKLQPLPGKKWEPPEAVCRQLLQVKARQRKALVFLPTLRLLESVGTAIVTWGKTIGLAGAITSSKTKNANRNKELLLHGKLDFIVASTILERGITIDDLDVLVLFADFERVFDCRTLVQIAGRAGRRGDPAQVFFFAESVNRAMQECRQWVERLNEDGRRLGYLDSPVGR